MLTSLVVFPDNGSVEWLNYHHLYYFWVIAQEGSITRAATRLRLTHSTLSAQVRMLEDFLGGELFDRKGKRLVLTQFGSEIADYASDLFRIGSEIVDLARGRDTSRRTIIRAGVVETIPKTVVYRLFEPALPRAMNASIQLRQDHFDALLGMLAANRLHLIVSDNLPPGGLSYNAHTHLLGETDILIYAAPALASRYAKDFPRSLDGAPFILPGAGTPLRREIDRWFVDQGLSVQIAVECNDSGHMRVFGGFGHGLFPVRSALKFEVEQVHDAVMVGKMDGVRERYYAVSLERRVRHPVVGAVIDSARELLLAPMTKRTQEGRSRPGRSRPAR
jgi:LysR family transcriptional activator of nhaA